MLVIIMFTSYISNYGGGGWGADVLDGAMVEVVDGDMEVVDGAQDTKAGDGVQDIAVAV